MVTAPSLSTLRREGYAQPAYPQPRRSRFKRDPSEIPCTGGHHAQNNPDQKKTTPHCRHARQWGACVPGARRVSVPRHVPRVQAVTPAGPDTLTLTLEDGQEVTVTACKGTAIGQGGVLLTDYHNGGPVYLLPPALAWEVGARLGLYSSHDDHRELDTYLLSLPSITEVDLSAGVLTLAAILPDGRRALRQFSGDLDVQFGRRELGENFTRYPLTVTIQEGEGMKLYAYRVDHTPAGYAALLALGWDAPLPALGEE